MPATANDPAAIAISTIAQFGRLVRVVSRYPTIPKPKPKAEYDGRLKKGEGARVRLGRVYSTPCSIAITASTRLAMKAMRKTIDSGVKLEKRLDGYGGL